jgi:hypothetical protein
VSAVANVGNLSDKRKLLSFYLPFCNFYFQPHRKSFIRSRNDTFPSPRHTQQSRTCLDGSANLHAKNIKSGGAGKSTLAATIAATAGTCTHHLARISSAGTYPEPSEKAESRALGLSGPTAIAHPLWPSCVLCLHPGTSCFQSIFRIPSPAPPPTLLESEASPPQPQSSKR